MKNIIYFIGILLFVYSISSGCKKTKDTIPDQQQILTYDTSGMTGKLTVYVKYLNPSNQVVNASNTDVFLYASRDDITADLAASNNDLAIYRLYTGTGNTAYFGYINYGNYYVLAFNNNIGGLSYSKTSIVQVRPQQNEVLTITMIH
ncbi:MAG: hypothetical protein HY951_02065 [Bacteroidia bacterium]|nr:hypothetical protein [Bacteroidia bacterium]